MTCILQLTLKQPQSILKIKFRAIYRSEKPRKKTFFTVKGGEGETHFKKKKKPRIKASYQYKRSNTYCQDHLLCSTSTLKRGHHLGRFQFDGEGNLAEMATIKSAFQIFLIKYSSWNSLRMVRETTEVHLLILKSFILKSTNRLKSLLYCNLIHVIHP